MGGDGGPPFSACDFQPARQSVGDAVGAAPLSHALLRRAAALTDRAHVVASRLAVAPLLALVLAGWGEAAMAEVEASSVAWPAASIRRRHSGPCGRVRPIPCC